MGAKLNKTLVELNNGLQDAVVFLKEENNLENNNDETIPLEKNNKELIYKKNLEQKTILCEALEKLRDEEDIICAYEKLAFLRKEYQKIGPVSDEYRGTIRHRFRNAVSTIEDRYKQHQEYTKKKDIDISDNSKKKLEDISSYDVFISYCRKDSKIADKICAVLQEHNITYFIDRRNIGGGMEFPVELARAIRSSRIFLFLASKNSYQSKFTINEITYAFNKKERNQLLPYIIDGSALPEDLELVFAGINWRNISDHPINTVLVADLQNLLKKDSSIP